jgi:3',5'-cyclic AMP phosphodiesterase CpdA
MGFRRINDWLSFRAVLFETTGLILACSTFALQATSTGEQPPEFNIKPGTNVFLAYGDPRFTDPAACEFSDQRYRTALVESMANSADKPDFLIVTGDVVLSGANDDDWRVFERETKALKKAKIPIFPVLGNHDVRGASGQSKFMQHFDELKSHEELKTQAWYSIHYGNAEFLMLDSQSQYDQDSPQGEWLRKKLKSVPEELAFLFVVLHHPLVTHASRIPFLSRCNGRHAKPARGHDVEGAEKRLKFLLDDFYKTRPGVRVVVISGHNHNYERYMVDGITYIVTGGGGATPYRISRHRTDFYNESGPTYHYCTFTIQGDVLQGAMYKINFTAGNTRLEEKDHFELIAPESTQ